MRAAVDLAGQEREVLAQGGGVERRCRASVSVRHASYPSVSRRAASSGPPSATIRPSTSRWTRSAPSSSSIRW